MNKKQLKSFIKESTITRPVYQIYKNVQKKYHDDRRARGIEKFVNNSSEVMGYIQKVFKNYPSELDFFFAYGTLLGIIRDGKLLSRDMDLDMVAFLRDDDDINKFRLFLQENGFKRLHSFKIKDIGINQDAFVVRDVMVDINYAKPAGTKYYNYNFYDLPEEKNKILIFPFTFGKSQVYKFGDILINIPENPELYLEETYGKDWMIPNANYIYWENPQTIKTDLMGEVEIINTFKYC